MSLRCVCGNLLNQHIKYRLHGSAYHVIEVMGVDNTSELLYLPFPPFCVEIWSIQEAS